MVWCMTSPLHSKIVSRKRYICICVRSFEVQIVLCRKVSSLSCRPTIARKQQQRKKGKRIKKEKTRRGRKGRKMRCRKEELPRSRWQMGMVGEVVVGVGEMVVRARWWCGWARCEKGVNGARVRVRVTQLYPPARAVEL